MIESTSPVGHTTRPLLALVAATALATTAVARPPAPAAADPPPQTTDPSAQPLPGAAAEDPSPPPAETDAPEEGPPPFGGPILERPKLTGDWCGCRTQLQDCGITLDVSTTQFYQGVASGGLEQSFPYGGRNDYFLNLDGEKLGLWKGFFVNLHGETRYGESANFITGPLSPVNEALRVPAEAGAVTALTGVKLIKLISDNY
jgi:porin